MGFAIFLPYFSRLELWIWIIVSVLGAAVIEFDGVPVDYYKSKKNVKKYFCLTLTIDNIKKYF